MNNSDFLIFFYYGMGPNILELQNVIPLDKSVNLGEVWEQYEILGDIDTKTDSMLEKHYIKCFIGSINK